MICSQTNYYATMKLTFILFFAVAKTALSFFSLFPCLFIIYKGNAILNNLKGQPHHLENSRIGELQTALIEKNINSCQMIAVLLAIIFISGLIILWFVRRIPKTGTGVKL